ncbi:CAAX amino terminal protease self- immunity [Anaerococcus prevotii]|uniref:Abortive infection protein n=1 Tax=Anaerococcus prevotii (strain ATCC 9321 / DSM 20548 / JCM 6508 / NCTC 11806 / PC1) TaxID=525919 RepID=C7RER7_ANAPD|nr:type II CAAX endopeptidase family protein [Anaerococcus prevotii]ACV29680.1 Abortive infection protein [Anaerococcus prevotii DSM 20548]SUU95352.1 CAAX amino terminal protease self- immunity [Anaerococcus prevotii]
MFYANESIKECKRVMKERNSLAFTIHLFILMILAMSFSHILIRLVSNLIGKGDFLIRKLGENHEYAMIFNLWSTLLVSLSVYIFVKYYQKRTPASLGLVDDKKGKSYLKGLLIGSGMIGVSFLFSYLLSGFKIRTNIYKVDFKIYLLFMIGWIFQGFEEEFITRSVLMNYLGAVRDPKVGIIANSLIFSILHLGNSYFNLLAFVNIFLMGLVFSMLFYIGDSIYISAAAHSVWNFLQANFFGINVSGIITSKNTIFLSESVGNKWISGGGFGIEASLVVTIVETLALYLLYKKARKVSLIR